jgi:hypothetical protein
LRTGMTLNYVSLGLIVFVSLWAKPVVVERESKNSI